MATTYEFTEVPAEGRWELKQFNNGTFQKGRGFAKGDVIMTVTNTEVEIMTKEKEEPGNVVIPLADISAPTFTDFIDLNTKLSAIVY
jgi:hypothetical protein